MSMTRRLHLSRRSVGGEGSSVGTSVRAIADYHVQNHHAASIRLMLLEMLPALTMEQARLTLLRTPRSGVEDRKVTVG